MSPSKTTFIQHIKKEDIQKYLTRNYVSFELLDPNKDYNYDDFEASYDEFPGITKFMYFCITFGFTDNDEIIKYLVVEPNMDDNDFSKIAPYCRCGKCTSWKWNPFKVFKCGCCHGCLHSSFPSSVILKETLKYMKNNGIKID